MNLLKLFIVTIFLLFLSCDDDDSSSETRGEFWQEWEYYGTQKSKFQCNDACDTCFKEYDDDGINRWSHIKGPSWQYIYDYCGTLPASGTPIDTSSGTGPGEGPGTTVDATELVKFSGAGADIANFDSWRTAIEFDEYTLKRSYIGISTSGEPRSFTITVDQSLFRDNSNGVFASLEENGNNMSKSLKLYSNSNNGSSPVSLQPGVNTLLLADNGNAGAYPRNDMFIDVFGINSNNIKTSYTGKSATLADDQLEVIVFNEKKIDNLYLYKTKGTGRELADDAVVLNHVNYTMQQAVSSITNVTVTRNDDIKSEIWDSNNNGCLDWALLPEKIEKTSAYWSNSEQMLLYNALLALYPNNPNNFLDEKVDAVSGIIIDKPITHGFVTERDIDGGSSKIPLVIDKKIYKQLLNKEDLFSVSINGDRTFFTISNSLPYDPEVDGDAILIPVEPVEGSILPAIPAGTIISSEEAWFSKGTAAGWTFSNFFAVTTKELDKDENLLNGITHETLHTNNVGPLKLHPESKYTDNIMVAKGDGETGRMLKYRKLYDKYADEIYQWSEIHAN